MSIRIQSMFFDRKPVIDALDRASRRVLSRFGAFVRRSARSSIRRRRRTSRPGEPPSSHEGSLRRLIYFAYDRRPRKVVIGPLRFRKGEAPPLLEYGGTAVRRDRRTGTSYVARYQPRPYMGPAFEKEQPKLPAMWRDSVRK